jgi:ribosomal-protein-alanine N-acetyltransferase
MSETGVRAMEEGDLSQVARIEQEAFGAHPRSNAMSESDLREELVRPWSRTWVSETQGHVSGFLLAWHIVDEIHVLNVAVKRDLRRKGIARHLLTQLFGYARAKQVVAMYLEVRVSNRAAIELYRVHGFYTVNLRRGYYSNGEDAVEMRLDFDAHGAVLWKPDEVPIPEAPPPEA